MEKRRKERLRFIDITALVFICAYSLFVASFYVCGIPMFIYEISVLGIFALWFICVSNGDRKSKGSESK